MVQEAAEDIEEEAAARAAARRREEVHKKAAAGYLGGGEEGAAAQAKFEPKTALRTGDDRRSVRHAKRHDGLGFGAVQCPRVDDGAAER